MTPKVLQDLESDAFRRRHEFLGTTEALRASLQRAAEVRELRRTLAAGGITEPSIRQYVNESLRDLRLGEPFRGDLTLTAICVALEDWSTDFAEEFLRDLSRVQLVELNRGRRVASLCLMAQQSSRGSCGHSLNVLVDLLPPERPTSETPYLATRDAMPISTRYECVP